METVVYTMEQIKEMVSLLNQITVSGDTSVISLAMVYQALNAGEIVKQEEVGDE